MDGRCGIRCWMKEPKRTVDSLSNCMIGNSAGRLLDNLLN